MAAAAVDAATPPRAAAANSSGPFKDLDVEGMPATFDFDFIVIGGGSGGLAAAKAAADLGAKVALCDFVTPSTQNSTWGLGGTCVNVGCIPKKLMHTAGLFGEHFRHSVTAYGWKVGGLMGGLSADGGGGEDEYDDGTTKPLNVKCDWETLRNNVEMHIRSLNFGYVATCRKKEVTYVNGYASFVDRWTIETKDRKGAVKAYTARRFLIATGGRPTVPSDVEGALEHAVTSDDIFRMRREPGRTLVVGASYVALECAGFLTGIGRDATVLMRSIPLRGFDQQSANLVVAAMEQYGTRVIRGAVPIRLSKDHKGGPEDERISVTFRVTGPGGFHSDDTEDFDTVMFATGRAPESKKIGLAAAGVAVNPKSDRVVVDDHDRTVVSNIYCIGDVAEGRPELTPVAIQAGRLLAARLYGGSQKLMAYNLVPTTVFTPLEYGCVGYSEERAVELFGADNIEVYHTYFTPLEWTVPHMGENMCYMKLICNLRDSERVIGFHVISPNAGEVTQGVAIAMRAGATKEQFDETVGIHPTIAEEMTTLEITKRSGLPAEKQGC